MSLSANIQLALKGFALDVALQTEGGLLGLLGASGSGKSMTLRCIAGLHRPDGGRVSLGGRTLYDGQRRINLRPQARKVGYLFQNYALFPHMTLESNIACGAHGALGKEQVGLLLERFQLGELAHHYPFQLSGGQQQRAALARSLIGQPEALLLDEPFSALDEHLRQDTRQEFLRLMQEYRGAVVLVTHDQQEAYQMCDQLAILDNGRLVAQGPPKALFQDPGTVGAARILGVGNIAKARYVSEHRVLLSDVGLELQVRRPVGKDIQYVGIRAQELRPSKDAGHPNRFLAQVRERVCGPYETQLWVAVRDVFVETVAAERLQVSMAVDQPQNPEYLWIDPASIMPLEP